MTRKISEETRQKNRERARLKRANMTDEERAQQKEYMARYRKENAEKIRQLNKRYHSQNREENNTYRRQWALDHPEKQRECQRRWYENNIDHVRNKRFLEKYGITLDHYNGLLAEQGGACAICTTDIPGGRGQHFHVDHDHTTGKIRGLLCHGCNTGLGNLKDDPEVLNRAAEYVRKARSAISGS